MSVSVFVKKKLGPTGDKIFKARLLRKYAGIKFVDMDSTPQRVFRVHPSTMQFEKERGNNHYSVVGILDGFDLETPLDQEDNSRCTSRGILLRTFMSV